MDWGHGGWSRDRLYADEWFSGLEEEDILREVICMMMGIIWRKPNLPKSRRKEVWMSGYVRPEVITRSSISEART